MKAPEPKEIREAYADFMSEWSDIQEEGKTDMRYVAGDPWEAKDRKASANRICGYQNTRHGEPLEGNCINGAIIR